MRHPRPAGARRTRIPFPEPPPPMDILFFSEQSPFLSNRVGGAENSMRLIAEGLAARGHRVRFASLRPDGLPWPRRFTVNGVEVALSASPRRSLVRRVAGRLPGGKALGRRLDARCVLGDDKPYGRDPARELRMRSRIGAVDAAAEDRHRLSARLECAAMRLAVHATRHPADDQKPCGCKLASERAGDVRPVGGARPRAHDADRRALEQDERRFPADEEPGRWVEDRGQRARKS